MNIAVLGTGNVGQALATGWVRAGHQVSFGSRDPSGSKAQELMAHFEQKISVKTTVDAVEGAEVVLLAVPWGAAEPVANSVAEWQNKVLIDATNPIAPGFELDVGHTNSGGEMVQSWANGARVVKAFNTTGYNNMLDPHYDGEPTVMLLAGDDEDAKRIVSQLAQDIGFDAADVGGLVKSRLIEPFAMTWINLAMVQGQGRDMAFRLVRR